MSPPDVNQPVYRRRARSFMRIAAAALPVGILLGTGIGFVLGVPVIGMAIGAGLGFGVAVAAFAGAIVARADDPDL